MVWPSSTKWRYSGSRSSRSRRLSIMRTSRARKASNGWYHSRSQWVWETTTSTRVGSDVMAGPRRKVVHTLPPHQILRGDAGFCAPPLFALSMTQHGSIMRTSRARNASNGWYHSRSQWVWETTTSTRVGSDVMAGPRRKVVHTPPPHQILREDAGFCAPPLFTLRMTQERSRPQWVWETTTSVRVASDIMAGPRRKAVHTPPPHRLL